VKVIFGTSFVGTPLSCENDEPEAATTAINMLATI
jgi:hypothetical protein